jgi:hypothetical protein
LGSAVSQFAFEGSVQQRGEERVQAGAAGSKIEFKLHWSIERVHRGFRNEF